MKIKYLLTLIAIVAITKDSFAQYAQDAVRFSTFQPGSTSRIKALGNAGTAVGGDMSSISGNPAGIGFFTHSEVSITPEYDASNVKTSYFGNNVKDNNDHANLSNAAVVLYQWLDTPPGQDKGKGWLSINYGAAYNRTNNFYENITYGGSGSGSSISDYYAKIANSAGNINPDDLDGWAYNQHLIDFYATPNKYQSNVVVPVNQAGSIARTGGQSEFNFAFGANYSNKLYIGVGVAITDINYTSSTIFSESGTASITSGQDPVAFNSAYVQSQTTKGSGLNAKLGIIYKPIQALRLGFVATTPTFYNIDDSYDEAMQTQFGNATPIYNGLAQTYDLNYNMRTPYKLAGGAAVFIGKYGFITGDVEYIDYSSTRISDNYDYNYSAQNDNDNIRANYRSVFNLRAGAEININSMVYLRGGYSLQPSPLKNNDGNNNDIKTATAGIGFRFGTYYVDATYMHLNNSDTINPYEVEQGTTPVATFNKTNNNVFLTFGYSF